MRRFLLSVLFALFALYVHAQSDVKDRVDRFRLWTGCQPVGLLVESLSESATEIGLTEESIQTLIRSRLRAARIYTPNSLSKFGNYNRDYNDIGW